MEEQKVLPAIGAHIQLHKNTIVPERRIVSEKEDMEEYSEDVITIDSKGVLCIAFYHFIDKKWYFHSDTLRKGYEKDFTWIYPPTGFRNWK
ncbi:hypothetical protein [Rufibacter soli]